MWSQGEQIMKYEMQNIRCKITFQDDTEEIWNDRREI